MKVMIIENAVIKLWYILTHVYRTDVDNKRLQVVTTKVKQPKKHARPPTATADCGRCGGLAVSLYLADIATLLKCYWDIPHTLSGNSIHFLWIRDTILAIWYRFFFQQFFSFYAKNCFSLYSCYAVIGNT